MPTRHRADRGSVLMLMPAAVLIVLVLGAIAVDLSLVHLARNDLVHAAGGAANDAVTYGLDEDAWRRGDGYVLDPARVDEAVTRSLAARGLLDRLAGPPIVRASGPTEITVELAVPVDYIFAKALPGGPRRTVVHAAATATVARR